MSIGNFLRRLAASMKRATPLITVSVSKANLLHNLHAYQAAYPQLRFAPVLKSNAYGHGLVLTARLLDKEQIAFFMVDSLFEARTLRTGGVRSRILVLGYVRPIDIAHNAWKDVDYGITDIEQLAELAKLAHKPVRLHLKLDTGMHRQGLLAEDLDRVIEIVRSNKNLVVVGVCSHFADAETPESAPTRKQIAAWTEMSRKVVHAFSTIEFRHFSATKGLEYSEEIEGNVSRLGIGLFGFDTSLSKSMPLKPVMEMRSFITSLRSIPPGDTVGYNAAFVANRQSTIATVPVGYFEGLDRGLSGKGYVQVRGQLAPIAGRVSMNMSSWDVTDVPNVSRGDGVVIVSRNPEDLNSIVSMARLADTTPYVILVHVPQHLKRVVE